MLYLDFSGQLKSEAKLNKNQAKLEFKLTIIRYLRITHSHFVFQSIESSEINNKYDDDENNELKIKIFKITGKI